jgi:hypothetical protein
MRCGEPRRKVEVKAGSTEKSTERLMGTKPEERFAFFAVPSQERKTTSRVARRKGR